MKRIFNFVVILLGLLVGVGYTSGADALWTKTFGGSGVDWGYSVQQTSDGGYIIAGGTSSYGSGGNVYLIKTNSSGDTLWTKTFGGSDAENGSSLQQTSDSGYIIAGYTASYGAGGYNIYLIKTNSSGNTLWTKTFGGSSNEESYSVQQTFDGGYIIAGYTASYGAGNDDVYLIKTNSSGDTLWTKTFGGSNAEGGYSLQQTSDSGYIIAGYTWSFGAGYCDVYLIKTNSSGDTLWTRTFGGNSPEIGYSVRQTSDSGYIITGCTWSYSENFGDVYLIKTNSSGDTLWTKTFGGSEEDMGCSVQQTLDGGYIIAGYTASYGAGNDDVYLIKTNSSGDTLWTKTFGGSGEDRGYSIQQISDDDYIISGYTWSFGAGYSDVYLIKISPVAVEEQTVSSSNKQVCNVTPNPVNSTAIFKYTIPASTNVRLRIYDLTGREVCTLINEYKSEGEHTVLWDGNDNNGQKAGTGIYFYSLEAGNLKTSRKLTILR